MGRAAGGVRGMTLREGDRVVGMEILSPGATILTVTERGYGKRTPLDDYRLQRRGGQGIITIRTSERNGQVVSVAQVVDDDEVMLITDGGKVLRARVSGISTMGRATQGVRLMNLDDDEKLASMARLAEQDVGGARHRRHRVKTGRSRRLFERARRVIPGGVNSPVRAFGAVGGTPRFVARARGARLWDVDGNALRRLRGLVGPADPRPRRPGRAARGARGAAARHELRRALRARDRARATRGRRAAVDRARAHGELGHRGHDERAAARARGDRPAQRILKFEGCYHGHADALLVGAGSGVATLGIPGSPGVPAGVHRAHRAGALQRSRRRVRRVRALGRRDRVRDRRAGRRQHGARAARARLPRGTARALHARGRAADLRRGDDRLPRRVRRRAGALRHRARPHLPRQGGGRRPARRPPTAAAPS